MKWCPFCQSGDTFDRWTRGQLIPHKGNSDPFDSQYVVIDAQSSLYLDVGFNMLDTYTWNIGFRVPGVPRGYLPQSFVRQDSDPITYLYGTQLKSLSSDTSQNWLSVHAYAVLASVAQFLFTVNGVDEDARNALQYSTKCVSALRRAISANAGDDTFHPEELVLRLLKSEMMAQRSTSAMVHTRFLETLVKRQAREGMLDRGFLCRLLFQVNNLAITLGTEPVLDALWVQQIFEADWYSLSPTDGTELGDLMQASKSLFADTASVGSGSMVVPADKWYILMSREHWLQMSLLHFVNDSHPVLDLMLAHTTLLAIRFSNTDASFFYGRPVFSQAYKTLDNLSMLYTRLDDFEHTSLLWIYFVAALVEHRHRTVLANEGVFGVWEQRLRQFLVKGQISAWDELCQLLWEYPYSEDELPLPTSDWLDITFELVKVKSSDDRRDTDGASHNATAE